MQALPTPSPGSRKHGVWKAQHSRSNSHLNLRSGDRASHRHLPPDPGALPLAPRREGRPMEGGQRFTPPPPNLTAPSCPEVAPQPAGTDASGPAACSPTAPAPPPILPAPQRPPTRVREWEGAAWAAGATGVGAALSALPGSKRLGRVPLTFGEASPGPRTPRPARARKLPRGAGGRGGAEHPAARGSAQRPPLAPLLLASQVSPSLLRSVRSCVRLSVGPSLPRRRRRGRRRSRPGSAARPLPASPLRSRARGLAGSLARALPPPLPAPRGAEPGGPPAAWRGPSSEGGGDGGAARAGRRGESGGGGEAAPLPPDRSPATERLQAGPERGGRDEEDLEPRRGRVPRARAC
ncbi:unnamed protein product [Rangifer tarandus platyrhynchus]|uniref:Basic proline-rich protein-like n=2 Tax=Rangifer tarandus platyrhynchus TaxID=3082113 RepID=A0ABN8XSX6_RANTA|nr:unnamed protein product [Rangifer tarandus platyrhynchus]